MAGQGTTQAPEIVSLAWFDANNNSIDGVAEMGYADRIKLRVTTRNTPDRTRLNLTMQQVPTNTHLLTFTNDEVRNNKVEFPLDRRVLFTNPIMAAVGSSQQEFLIEAHFGNSLLVANARSPFAIGINRTVPNTIGLLMKMREANLLPLTSSRNISVTRVGQGDTNVPAYRRCGFSEITAQVRETEITLFSYGTSGSRPENLVLPITSGVNRAITEVHIEMDTNTADCLCETTNTPIHKGRVVDLSAFDSSNIAFIQAERSRSNTNRNSRVSGGGAQITFQIPGVASGRLERVQELIALRNPRSVTGNVSDNHIRLNLPYDYTDGGRQSPAMGLVRTFIPANARLIQRYPITLRTCRFPNTPINIDVFPDARWTLQLALNYSAKKFKEMRENLEERAEWAYEEYVANEEREVLSEEEKDAFRDSVEEALRKSERSDAELLDPVHLMNAGVLKFGLSLVCAIDGGRIRIGVHDAFPQVTRLIRSIFDMIARVDRIIDGTDPDTLSTDERVRGDSFQGRIEALRNNAKLQKAKTFYFKFLPPQLAVIFSWEAKSPQNVLPPQMGTLFTGQIETRPLFGYSVKLNLLRAAGKVHPVIKAAVILLEILQSATDNFTAIFYMTVEGRVNLNGRGEFNTVPGSHNNSQITLTGEIKIKIVAEVKVQFEINMLLFAVGANAEASGKVESGIAFGGTMRADADGLFLIPSIDFAGIILRGNASAGVAMGRARGFGMGRWQDSAWRMGVRTEGTIEVMRARKWPLGRIPIMTNSNNNE